MIGDLVSTIELIAKEHNEKWSVQYKLIYYTAEPEIRTPNREEIQKYNQYHKKQ